MVQFNDKKAWFSSSVPEFCKEIWLGRNGQIASDIFCADFIFAKDPEAPDIAWFYKTHFFLKEGIMPFNSTWLKNPSKTILDFILYPKGFQERNLPDEWEFVDEQDSTRFVCMKDFKAAKDLSELRPALEMTENSPEQHIPSTAESTLDCTEINNMDNVNESGSETRMETTLKTKKNVRRSSQVLTTLQDLEVHEHSFHSSLHDGFIHVQDIQVPDGICLEDFSVSTINYQVFLLDPP